MKKEKTCPRCKGTKVEHGCVGMGRCTRCLGTGKASPALPKVIWNAKDLRGRFVKDEKFKQGEGNGK